MKTLRMVTRREDLQRRFAEAIQRGKSIMIEPNAILAVHKRTRELTDPMS